MNDVDRLLQELQSELSDCENAYKQALSGDMSFDEMKAIYLRCKKLKELLELMIQNYLS